VVLFAVTAAFIPASSAWATLIATKAGDTLAVTTSALNTNYPLAGDSAAFDAVGLWDAGSSKVGGGSISGTLYIAFIARLLDREGDSNYIPNPPGAVGGLPTPGNSFGSGEIANGTSQIIGIGNRWPNWAYSTHSHSGDGDLSPRSDPSPNNPMTFLLQIDFNPGVNDDMFVTGYDVVGTPHTKNIVGVEDLSFNAWQFRAGNANVTWEFSQVGFATTAAEALANVPEPSTLLLAALGLLGLLARGRRRRSTKDEVPRTKY